MIAENGSRDRILDILVPLVKGPLSKKELKEKCVLKGSTFYDYFDLCRNEEMKLIKEDFVGYRESHVSITNAGREYYDSNGASLMKTRNLEGHTFHFTPDLYKKLVGGMITATEEVMYMTSIGASALANDTDKQWAERTLPKLIDGQKSIRMILTKENVSHEKLDWLLNHKIAVALVQGYSLKSPEFLLRPDIPEVEDLCHLVLTDGLNWAWCKTRDGHNSREGVGCYNDEVNGPKLRRILDAIWSVTYEPRSMQ